MKRRINNNNNYNNDDNNNMIMIIILILIIIIIIIIMKTFRKSIYCHFFPFIYKLKSFQPSPATLTPPPPSPHSRDVLCGEGDLLTLGVGGVLLPVPGQCVVGVERHHAHVVRRRRWWQQGTAACRGRQREGRTEGRRAANQRAAGRPNTHHRVGRWPAGGAHTQTGSVPLGFLSCDCRDAD